MEREIKIATVSWIEDKPNPMWTAAQAETLGPAWVPKTYLGLTATSNPTPASTISDFKNFQKDKNFRALTYCRFKVEIDDSTKQVTSFKVLDAVHDGGWTPPFRMRSWPSTVFAFDTSIYSITWYQGECSPLTLVNTQARHTNTTITTVPANETVLVNAVIKFRAGSHTDDIGIKKVGAPYHVPWVWHEMILTYANGQFKMYGRGSIFPTHAWYFNDNVINTQARVGDSTFPTNSGPVPMLAITGMPNATLKTMPVFPTSINVSALKLYPVLSKGVPAGQPQSALSSESGKTGSVENHANTVSGGAVWSKVVT